MQEIIERLKKEIKSNGNLVEDFVIRINGGLVEVYPKSSYQIRLISKQEDKPIKEDIDVVAETTVTTMSDINIAGETIAYLMSEITSLRLELEEVKNG